MNQLSFINELIIFPLGVSINGKFYSLADLDFARYPVAYYHFIKSLRQAVLDQSADIIYSLAKSNKSGRRWEIFNKVFGCFFIATDKKKLSSLSQGFRKIKAIFYDVQLSCFDWWQALPYIPVFFVNQLELDIFGAL